jgi:hypothetical protein
MVVDASTVGATWPGFVGVLAVAAMHWIGGSVMRDAEERPAWQTFAAGVAVAYVFVHILPELARHQAEFLAATPSRPLRWLTEQVYVTAMIGLLLALAVRRRRRRGAVHRSFRIDLTWSALENVLIGLAATRLRTWPAVLLAVIAFGGYLLLSDRQLRRVWEDGYRRVGRKVLAACIVAGWLLGTLLPLPPVVTAAAFGVIAGVILLQTLAEELPRRTAGPYFYFAAGAIGYAVLLLLLQYAVRVDVSVGGRPPG